MAKADAEAAKAKIDVEVAASKAKAESEAAKARAAAEVARAEVEAAKAKIDVEAAASKARAEAAWDQLPRLLAGLVALGALWLGFDHLTHSFGPYVRWQMKRKLRQGPLEEALPNTPAHEFPMKYPSFDSELPILLLGHTGSGKSTILGNLARDFKLRGIPVVHFRLRALGSEKSSVDPSDTQTFSSAATAVFEAIGYPPRPSLLSRLSILGGGVGNKGVTAEVGIDDAREAVAHFQHAVSDLFRVCRELYGERGHCSKKDRSPVILADELHDLIHTDRLQRLGGDTIFRLFSAEFATNCTVRFCAAASSHKLQNAIDATAAKGDRTRVFITSDPPAEAVHQRLCDIGFSGASAGLILGTCGTRLRLLSPFLDSSSAGSMDVEHELRLIVNKARSQIKRLFTLLQEDAAAKRELGLLLDKLCAGGEVSLSNLSTQLQDLYLASPSADSVLYLKSGDSLEIQSQSYCVAWRELRKGDYKDS
jgi:hypothetical protein